MQQKKEGILHIWKMKSENTSKIRVTPSINVEIELYISEVEHHQYFPFLK